MVSAGSLDSDFAGSASTGDFGDLSSFSLFFFFLFFLEDLDVFLSSFCSGSGWGSGSGGFSALAAAFCAAFLAFFFLFFLAWAERTSPTGDSSVGGVLLAPWPSASSPGVQFGQQDSLTFTLIHSSHTLYLGGILVLRVRPLKVLDLSILGYLHVVKVGILDVVILGLGPMKARPGRTELDISWWWATHTCGTSTSALSEGISTERT